MTSAALPELPPGKVEGGSSDRLLRLRQVLDRVGLSKATVYRKISAGEFPRPVSVGRISVRWRESDVGGWIAALS
jgi:prophage regulatory protein